MPSIAETAVGDDPVGVPRARRRARTDPRRSHDAVDRPGRHPGRLARRPTARSSSGAMDDIDFLHPVKVGEIAILRAQVEYVGTSSLEVGVRVWAENVATRRARGHAELAPGLRQRRRGRRAAAGRRQASCRATPPRPRWSRRRARGAERSGWPASPSGPDGSATPTPTTRRGRPLAVRVGALGAARGRAVRQHDVPGQDADGDRRGGRHPVDAILPGLRDDGVPRRDGLLHADLVATRW